MYNIHLGNDFRSFPNTYEEIRIQNIQEISNFCSRKMAAISAQFVMLCILKVNSADSAFYVLCFKSPLRRRSFSAPARKAKTEQRKRKCFFAKLEFYTIEAKKDFSKKVCHLHFLSNFPQPLEQQPRHWPRWPLFWPFCHPRGGLV